MGKTPAPSANLLVIGSIGSAVGGVLNIAGMGMNAAEVVGAYGKATNPGAGLIVLGLLIALTGAGVLLTGLYNLASGVDYLVSAAAPAAPAAPAEAPVEAPADTL